MQAPRAHPPGLLSCSDDAVALTAVPCVLLGPRYSRAAADVRMVLSRPETVHLMLDRDMDGGSCFEDYVLNILQWMQVNPSLCEPDRICRRLLSCSANPGSFLL